MLNYLATHFCHEAASGAQSACHAGHDSFRWSHPMQGGVGKDGVKLVNERQLRTVADYGVNPPASVDRGVHLLFCDKH